MSAFLPISLILLPVLGGLGFFLMPGLKEKKRRQFWICGVLGLEVAMAVILVSKGEYLPINQDRQSVWTLWNFIGDIKIALSMDGLSRMFLVLFSVMWLLAGIYSLEYMEHEEHISRFYGFYLLTLASLMGIALSANMVTLYLFYEFMTLLSLPLVLHNQTPEAKQAGFKYLFYSVAGAFLALGGLVLVLYGGGSVDPSAAFRAGGTFQAGGESSVVYSPAGEPLFWADWREGKMVLAGTFLMILGFGTKAGMFPMQSWLPTAHPVAPAPASAVLSGVITKSGVFAIIRAVYYVVGARAIYGSWVQMAWLALSLVTVFLGSMLAYKEKILKKRLAFSTVSQVSYVMFGLATMTEWGMLGALLHIVFHSIVKNTLFFCAGSIIHHTGKTKVAELSGIGKEMPVTLWCFTLVSITLVGIPPTSAFISKWYLAQGAMQLGTGFPGIFTYGGPVVLLLSALLTAGYLVTISLRGFLPGADYDYAALKKREAGIRMLLPMLLLTVAAVVLGMYVTPLLSFLENLVQGFLYG